MGTVSVEVVNAWVNRVASLQRISIPDLVDVTFSFEQVVSETESLLTTISRTDDLSDCLQEVWVISVKSNKKYNNLYMLDRFYKFRP